MSKDGHRAPTEEEMDAIRREATDFAGIGLYRYGFDGTVWLMDKGAMRILDLEELYPDPKAVIGMDIGELLTYTGERGYLRARIREHGRARGLEYPFRTLTGKNRWAVHDSYLKIDQDTGEESIQVIIQDITERKRAAILLATERERLAVTLRSIGDAVITSDIDGRITLMNIVSEKLTGWSSLEAHGRPLTDVFQIVNQRTREVCDNPVNAVLESGTIVGLANHTVLISKDGTERAIADSAAPIRDQSGEVIGVVLVFRDETEKQRLEAELQRVAKLESVGVLAGGIAHDFNNLLTAILGNIGLAQLTSASDDEISPFLYQAEQAGLRAKDLTQQLLTFASGGEPIRRSANVDAIAKEAAGFALSGSAVRCEWVCPDDLWSVDADPGQIAQVFHNLVINAVQAMPEGGRLEIAFENLGCPVAAPIPLAAGCFVGISVRDEGVGIDPDQLARIFDPYFTTKQTGSGLGLTVAHSIISQHGGHLTAESVPGSGTTFRIYLPISQMEVDDETGEHLPAALGTGRILVMDDESAVRGVMGQMLMSLGYDVDYAVDGIEALAKYQQAMKENRRFDLAILDLTIPGGAGGAGAVQELRALDPDLIAIAVSGYSTDPVMARYREYGFAGAVPKPFNMHDLSQAVARALRLTEPSDEDPKA